MAKEEKAAEVEDGEEGGGKKKMIMIIGGVVLLIGIAVGATLFLMGGDEAPAEGDVAAEEAVLEEPKGDPIYVELKPAFTVNLDPNDPVGFLQIGIQVLTYYEAVGEELKTHSPLIKNNLFTLFGQLKSADIRSQEGKKELQKKVLEVVQDVIDKYGSGGEVDNVFFTDFVMQ